MLKLADCFSSLFSSLFFRESEKDWNVCKLPEVLFKHLLVKSYLERFELEAQFSVLVDLQNVTCLVIDISLQGFPKEYSFWVILAGSLFSNWFPLLEKSAIAEHVLKEMDHMTLTGPTFAWLTEQPEWRSERCERHLPLKRESQRWTEIRGLKRLEPAQVT